MFQKTIADRYEILDKLGHGGMGEVYRVRDRLTRETIALKKVHLVPQDTDSTTDDHSTSNDYISLTREFQTLASLRHPNIISVLDYGYDRGRAPFYTMEYIENPTDIQEASRPLDIKGKVHLLIDLLHGLAYLHRRQIIHRDLKPANVLVVGDQVKVLDFGLAMVQNEIKTAQDTNLTGTIAYMAPELFYRKEPGIASDLYAVGMIAYQLLVGDYPFDVTKPETLIADVLSKTPDVWSVGLPENLAMIIGRLIAKTPDERYDSATRVIQDLYRAIGETVRQEPLAIRRSYLQAAQFVGREAELHQLEDALGETLSGHGSAWLVAGESGIGKSRLLDELRIRALVKGAAVLRGQAVEGGGLPFQLWRQVIRHLLLSTGLTDLEKQVLKEIVPDIGLLLDEDVSDPPPLDGTDKQRRLILTIVDVVRRQTSPLVLLLEDLQWSSESLEPIKYLNASVSDLPLLIIGNYRNDETPRLAEQLQDMRLITLNRLDEDEIATLSVSMLGDAGRRPQVLDVLRQETEGNCFFMVEVVQALAEDAGRLADIGMKTLPDHVFAGSVHQVIRRRLDRAPSWGHDLLELSAIIGRRLDLAVIEYIIEREPQFLPEQYSVELWLNACADCAVIEVQEQAWRFSHDKLREEILREITTSAKSRLHGLVAAALEAIYPDNDDYNEILLEHWHHAGATDKEIHYLNPVAEQVIMIRGDYEHACWILERGSRLLSDDDPRQPGLWNWLSHACEMQSEVDRARHYAQQARQLAEQTGDQKEIARSLHNLGVIAQAQSDYERARDYHQQSLAIRRELDDPEGIANSLNNLGIGAYFEGDSAQALDYFQQSLALFREINHLQGIARSLNNLANVNDSIGDYQTGTVCHQESLAIRHQLGDQFGIALSGNNLGITAFEKGEYEQAQDYARQSLAIFQKISHQRGIAASLANLGKIAYERGNNATASDYFQQSLSIRQSIGEQNGMAGCLEDLGKVALRQGDLDRAEDYFQQSLDICQRIGNQLSAANSLNLLGLVAYYREHYQVACDYHQQSLSICQSAGDQKGIASTLKALGFVYIRQQESQALPTLREALKVARSTQVKTLVLEILVGFAWLYMQQNNLTRAGNLAGLVQYHPIQTQSIRGRLDELMPRLEAQFDTAKLHLEMRRGRKLALDTIVADLLREFADKSG